MSNRSVVYPSHVVLVVACTMNLQVSLIIMPLIACLLFINPADRDEGDDQDTAASNNIEGTVELMRSDTEKVTCFRCMDTREGQ